MTFAVATIFPLMFQGFLSEGIVARAIARGLTDVKLLNIREFTTDSYRTVDDYPYGGGPGMVMKPEPILRAVGSLTGTDLLTQESSQPRCLEGHRIVLLSPQGRRFDQKLAGEISAERSVVLICGRYKAVDERVKEMLGAEEISVGDYVLSGGELAAMVIIESAVRLLPGAMEDEDSAAGDSFTDGLLDSAYYTRPEVVAGRRVPDVLLSGNHEAIRKWRRQSSLRKTADRRPDLMEGRILSDEDTELIDKRH
jgi:tRNA (guanine37-N1)-methyltransferase